MLKVETKIEGEFVHCPIKLKHISIKNCRNCNNFVRYSIKGFACRKETLKQFYGVA